MKTCLKARHSASVGTCGAANAIFEPENRTILMRTEFEDHLSDLASRF